jgi:carboxypeptidase C (cathepsin A)
MITKDLGVRMERPYGSIVWKDLLLAWNWQRNLPRPDDYAHDLGVAMRRNPALRVMVASGYYDLGSQSSHAENAVEQAGWPADRYTLRRYPSGHMLYIGDTAEAFANDVRELIRRASP